MSSARNTGKQLDDRAQAINTVVAPGVVTAPDNEADAQTAGGIAAKTFPRRFKGPDPEWIKMQKLKNQLVEQGGADAQAMQMTPFGQKVLSEKDLKELLKVEESAKEVAFDAWFQKNWNKADLPTRILAQKLHPEFYAQREQMMADKAALALKIKKIQLRGPRDEEDLQIIYGMQSGDIELFPGWDVIGFVPEGGNGRNTTRWERQMEGQYTFWDTGNVKQQNAIDNRGNRGDLGATELYGNANLGNRMLFGRGGNRTATEGIWNRLF